MRVLVVAALAAATDPVPVLTVKGTVQHVDFGQIVTQPGALNATVNALTQFFTAMVCGGGDVTDPAEVNFPSPAPAPAAPAPAPAAPVPEGVPAAPIADAALLSLKRWTLRNDTNGSNASNASAANDTASCAGGSPIVLLWYGSMNVMVELDYSAEAEKLFKDPSFPRTFSNFLLTVPQVILYADQPPIVSSVEVEASNVTSMVPDCAAHVPKILESFRHSYTNRMTPWALNAACGYFMTGLSFTTEEKPTDDDRVFCETASKHLTRTHFAGEQDYESWCHAVCEHRHGPTRVCKIPEAAAEGGADAPAENATAANASFVQRRGLRRVRHA